MNISIFKVMGIHVKRSGQAGSGTVVIAPERVRAVDISQVKEPVVENTANREEDKSCRPVVSATQFGYFLLMSRLQ